MPTLAWLCYYRDEGNNLQAPDIVYTEPCKHHGYDKIIAIVYFELSIEEIN